MASHWWKASVRKSVTLDKRFISSLTETPSPSDFRHRDMGQMQFFYPIRPVFNSIHNFIVPQGEIHLASQI